MLILQKKNLPPMPVIKSELDSNFVDLLRDDLRKKYKERNLKAEGNCSELIIRLTIKSRKRKKNRRRTIFSEESCF